MYDSEVRKRTTKAQGKQEGLTIRKKDKLRNLKIRMICQSFCKKPSSFYRKKIHRSINIQTNTVFHCFKESIEKMLNISCPCFKGFQKALEEVQPSFLHFQTGNNIYAQRNAQKDIQKDICQNVNSIYLLVTDLEAIFLSSLYFPILLELFTVRLYHFYSQNKTPKAIFIFLTVRNMIQCEI